MTRAWVTPFSQHSVCLVRVRLASVHMWGAADMCTLHCQEPWHKAQSRCHLWLRSLAALAGWMVSEKPSIAKRHRTANPALETSQGMGEYHRTLAVFGDFHLIHRNAK